MRRFLDNVVVRLAAHYAVIAAVYVGLLRLVPGLDDLVVRERARVITKTVIDSSVPGSIGALAPPTDADALALIALTLFGAMLVAFPVALVYQWTNEPEAYRPDFSRSLLVLPIAVALAVFLVKDSLALAFGLGGIVAVIRWRTTLRESMDGVFMFVVIGIGLAAGVQLLIVALVGSVVFNFTILALSRARFARQPRRVGGGWTLTAPAAEQPPPRRTVSIRIDASNQARAEEYLATVLPLCAKEWRKSSESVQPNGHARLEYRITLKKSQSPDSLVSTISRLRTPEIEGVALTTES
jgi:hypothetical protein